MLAAVDRLTAEIRAADDAHRRDPDEQRLRERLEDAVIGARTVTGELLGQVEQLEQYALSHRRWDLETRLRAVAGARSVDAMALVREAGEPSQGQVEAAARVERALAALRPDADEIEHGFEDLRGGLRRLQRALRDVLGHRVDRPLSLRHLRLLLDGSFRVLSTAAVGLLAVLALATRDGAAHGDAAVAAATAAAAPVDGPGRAGPPAAATPDPGAAAAGRPRRPDLPGRRLRPRGRARRRTRPGWRSCTRRR